MHKPSPEVNSLIDTLLDQIHQECAAVEKTESDALGHAITAGQHLNRVRDLLPKQTPGGFRGWLAEHDLTKTQAYDFMLLAAHEESVRRSGHTSILGALKMLRAKLGKTDEPVVTPITTNPPAAVAMEPVDQIDKTSLGPALITTWLQTYATKAERLEVLAAVLRETTVDDFRAQAPSGLIRELLAKTNALKKESKSRARANDRRLFRNKEEELHALRLSKQATERDQRSAEADARGAKFRDVNTLN
jgi:hypothetical protein